MELGLGIFWGLRSHLLFGVQQVHQDNLHVLICLHCIHATHLLIKFLEQRHRHLFIELYNIHPAICRLQKFGILVHQIYLNYLLQQDVVLVDKSLFDLDCFGLLARGGSDASISHRLLGG